MAKTRLRADIPVALWVRTVPKGTVRLIALGRLIPNAVALLSLAKLSYRALPEISGNAVDMGASLANPTLPVGAFMTAFEWSNVELCPSAIVLFVNGPLL